MRAESFQTGFMITAVTGCEELVVLCDGEVSSQ